MLGVKGPKKIEGWEIEVSEREANIGTQSIIQRLADNNRLWMVVFIVIVASTLFFIYQSTIVDESLTDTPEIETGIEGGGEFTPEHSEFEAAFNADKKFSAILINSYFENTGNFHITVFDGVIAADAEYISRIAARRILSKLNHRVEVDVYRKTDSGEVKIIETKWDNKMHAFVSKASTQN